MGEFERPDFAGIVAKLKDCLERELASVANVVREKGGGGGRIVVEAFGDLILFDLA